MMGKLKFLVLGRVCLGVDGIDNGSVIKVKKFWVDQVWSSDGEKVLVRTNDLGRPIGEEGGIFSYAMSHLAKTKYAIDYEALPDIPNSIKDDVFNRLVMEMCRQNARNRRKQTIPHIVGSKSFARKKDKMEKERQGSIGRAELWDAVHRRNDGSYVNDKGRSIGEKLQEASS